MAVTKAKLMAATIDCTMITIETGADATLKEFGFETSNKILVEPQVEEQDAVKLIIKGKLIAQKPAKRTITGHRLTITDNVFIPELVLVLQGGAIIYDAVDTSKIIGYDPPAIGDTTGGEVFKLNVYTAQYNAAGQIVNYEKTTYPGCIGQYVAFNSEDGVFRAPEYIIDSTVDTGVKPYEIRYVDALPTLT
jgi:hypothetical protein